MKKFMEPSVELLSFQPQEATLAAWDDATYGVASLANWWDDEE